MATKNEILTVMEAMKRQLKWAGLGYIITHEQIEADDHAHALQGAVDYFKANDPDRLEALLKG